jgi:hypothetical protein
MLPLYVWSFPMPFLSGTLFPRPALRRAVSAKPTAETRQAAHAQFGAAPASGARPILSIFR